MHNTNKSSLWNKSFNWIANHTYRQIPARIFSYSFKNSQLKSLCFQDYLTSPQLAREAGLLCAKQNGMDFSKRKQGIQKAVSQFKAKNSSQIQRPHEFFCPICLEVINRPVTTSCSHSFCHMCIDEAVLFNANCPVCRNQIRGEQLVISKLIQNIIQMLLIKFELEEVQKYVKKEIQYENWLNRRSIKKQQIDIGDCIDVRDTEFIWCRATIKDIFPKQCAIKSQRQAVLVHYEGWANVFDEVISLDSQRLATYKFYTSRMQIPHYNLSVDNPEHLRSAVVIGQVFNPPPLNLENSFSDSNSFELISQQQPVLQSSQSLQSYDGNYQEIFNRFNRISNDYNLFENNFPLEPVQPVQPAQIGQMIRQIINSTASRNPGHLFSRLNQQVINSDNSSIRAQITIQKNQEQVDELERLNQSIQNQKNFCQFKQSIQQKFQIQDEINNINAEEQSDFSGQPIQNSFVDSLELYCEKIPGLINKLSARKDFNRRRYSLNQKEQQTERKQAPQNISLSDCIFDQASVSQVDKINQTENNRDNLGYEPFMVDIERIQFKEIDEQIRSLGRAQKQMNFKIQASENQVRQDLKRWNQLNSMIEKYIQSCQNPQVLIDEEDPLNPNEDLINFSQAVWRFY